MKRLLLLAGLLAFSSAHAFEKPTWCGKAEKASEKMVCEDEALSASAIALDKKWDIFKATQDQEAIDKARTFLRMWNKDIVQKCTNKSCIAAAHEIAINNELLVMDEKSSSSSKLSEIMAGLPSASDDSCIEAKGFMEQRGLSSDEQVKELQNLMAISPDCERYGITWSFIAGSIKGASVLLYDLSEKPESIYRIQFLDLTGRVAKPTFNYIKLSPAPRGDVLKDEPADGFDPPIVEDKGHELPKLPTGTSDFLQKKLVPTIE
jgi:uncharacterized protein